MKKNNIMFAELAQKTVQNSNNTIKYLNKHFPNVPALQHKRDEIIDEIEHKIKKI